MAHPLNSRADGAYLSRHGRGVGPGKFEPSDFWADFRSNPRGLFLVVLGGVIAVGLGLSTSLGAGATWLERAVGVATVAAGVLIWVSYTLYYHPGRLVSAEWQGSPVRRFVVAILRYLWIAAALVAGIGSVISRITGAK